MQTTNLKLHTTSKHEKMNYSSSRTTQNAYDDIHGQLHPSSKRHGGIYISSKNQQNVAIVHQEIFQYLSIWVVGGYR
jgi:virulence-associated protein VapD